jgi:hypothetical protein
MFSTVLDNDTKLFDRTKVNYSNSSYVPRLISIGNLNKKSPSVLKTAGQKVLLIIIFFNYQIDKFL